MGKEMKHAIVYGPRGCGKTANAELMRERFVLAHVHDEWNTGKDVQANTLHLTSDAAVLTAINTLGVGTANSLGLFRYSDLIGDKA